MPTLIATVKSYMTSDIYGMAGDEVSVIADYGKVAIVELKGARFSVRKDNLTNDKREVEVIESLTKPIINKAPAKLKGQKAGATNTNLLF